MKYEVELKFPIADTAALKAALLGLGAQSQTPLEQSDLYFRHPVRDFAQTDEALRIRVTGGEAHITYKGPVIDSQTKTRHEIELPIGRESRDGERMGEILEKLGFTRVATVSKRRTPYVMTWENRPFEVVFDQVEGLGSFVEIETVAEDDERLAARDSVLRLANRLGLENPQRKSYLCLLLERTDTKRQ